MTEGDKTAIAMTFLAAGCLFTGFVGGYREGKADRPAIVADAKPADWHTYSKSGVTLGCTAPGVVCFPADTKPAPRNTDYNSSAGRLVTEMKDDRLCPQGYEAADEGGASMDDLYVPAEPIATNNARWLALLAHRGLGLLPMAEAVRRGLLFRDSCLIVAPVPMPGQSGGWPQSVIVPANKVATP